jgi:hypothetical protein
MEASWQSTQTTTNPELVKYETIPLNQQFARATRA